MHSAVVVAVAVVVKQFIKENRSHDVFRLENKIGLQGPAQRQRDTTGRQHVP